MGTPKRNDESQPAYIIHNFDYDAVESVTGFDRREVMASINEYDNKMDDLGLLGYIDLGYILTEAIVGIVADIKFDGSRQQLMSTDYFTMLFDMLSQDEDNFENLDDVVSQGANLCFRIHNFFVIGFTSRIDYDERCYLASVVYPQDDYEMTTKAVELYDDVIILGCGIPHELDEDEEVLQQIHANLVARINRRLSNSTQRGR